MIRLFNLQVINGQKYYDKSHAVTVENIDAQGERGLIFDKRGEKLAYNIKVYDVLLRYRRKTADQLNKELLQLYDLLLGSNEKIISDLPLYLTIDPISYGSNLKSDSYTQDWLKQMVIKQSDLSKLETAKDIFEYFKIKNKFDISDENYDRDPAN